MKKCLVLFCVLIFSFAKAQSVQELEVNFKTASYKLDGSETAKINSLIQSLIKKPQSYKITIIGHTDNVGDFDYNKILSDNRANQIATYFRNNGFSNIYTSGKAYSEPKAANVTATGKSKNRRVKIIVSTDVPKVNSLGGLTLKEDIFKIDTRKEQVVNYKSGSKITIPADAFVDEDGNAVKGEVDLSYIEYRNPVDFILGNISMKFGKDHFNSAGMYKILAYKDGKPVFLKEGKNIDIDFPLEADLPELNFYSYDTISDKWTELSKFDDKEITGEFDEDTQDKVLQKKALNIPTAAIFKRALLQYQGYCGNDYCSSLKTTISTGLEYAQSEGSVFEKYTKMNDAANAKTILQSKYQDSLFREVNKEKFAAVDKQINTFNFQISNNNARIGKIPEKIKKTIPYYSLTKLSTLNNQLVFRINLKAIYNVETTDFKNTKWIYDTSKYKVPETQIFETKWTSCQIETAGQNVYSVVLKDSLQTFTLYNLQMSNAKIGKNDPSVLVAALNNVMEIQQAKAIKLEAMKRRLLAQNKKFQSKIEKLQNAKLRPNTDYLNNPADAFTCFWSNSKAYMPAEETAMSIEGWYQFFDKNKTTMLQRYAAIDSVSECEKYTKNTEKRNQEWAVANKDAEQVRKSLKISNLGIFNCDQIARLFNPVIVDAQYKTEDGTPFKPVFIYLVDSKINGIICYDGFNNLDPTHFAYSPTSKNTLLAFDGSGVSYILNAEDFRNSSASKNSPVLTLTMKKIENISNREQLAELF